VVAPPPWHSREEARRRSVDQVHRAGVGPIRATQAGTARPDDPPMQRPREPLAAVMAALAVFVGIVAPSLMLVLAVSLAGLCLTVLALSAATRSRTDDRHGMQNPR